jgi:hypothetical protein
MSAIWRQLFSAGIIDVFSLINLHGAKGCCRFRKDHGWDKIRKKRNKVKACMIIA